MVDPVSSHEDIKDTDIVFDCPFCGKSLAIDYRGAGLTIPCSDCGRDVAVPIPEGMELNDIDSSDEEQEVRILHLRRSLVAAEHKAEQLQLEVEEIRERREFLERHRSDSIFRISKVAEQMDIIQGAIKNINESIRIIMDVVKEEKD